jgi:hypothetical protein
MREQYRGTAPKRRLRIIGRLTPSLILQEARSKDALLGMLIFPVLIFVFFGFVFGENSFDAKDMIVGIDSALYSEGNESKLFERVLKQNDDLNIKPLDPREGNKMLAEGRIQALIVKLPGNDYYTVYVTERSLPSVSFLSALLDRFNLETVKPFFRGGMPFEYELEVVSYKGKRLSYVYFLLAGVMAIALMMNGLFAIPQTIINYRKLGFLNRFAFSPLRKFKFTCSLLLQRLLLGALQVVLPAASAVIIFGIQLTVAPFPFLDCDLSIPEAGLTNRSQVEVGV